MCSEHIKAFLEALPKCEHHVHIEGTLSPSLQFALAKRNNISLPSDDPSFASVEELQKRYDRFNSLDDFLHYYYVGMSVLITAADFEELATEYFKRAHREGVHHAEIFFDPQAHTSRGIDLAEVTQALTRASIFAQQELGMSAMIIPCFLRHLPQKDALEHLELLTPDLLNGTLHGVGLDSSEKGFPPDLFRDVFAHAKRLGIRRTAHAGEEGGPDSIRSALDALDIMRVDHGVAMERDEGLMQELARVKVLVTVCPVSNIQLKVFEELSQVPIKKFLRYGVPFSLNSDDPAYFGAWILDCYVRIQETFDLTAADWQVITQNAIDGSWCDTDRKAELQALLHTVINKAKQAAASINSGQGRFEDERFWGLLHEA